jgi:mycothiol synthase
MSDKLPQLVMFRSSLEDLQPNSLPEGYSLRHYNSKEDADAWNNIIEESFQWQADFDNAIKADSAFRPEQVWFVCHDQLPVATATAWHRPEWGETVGYLHMVGLLPKYAGKGLGLQASLAALHQMKKEGKKSAVLETDDFRLPAIKTYLRLGFQPKFTHESHPGRWDNVSKLLSPGK